MEKTNVEIIREARIGKNDEWNLCFQLVDYMYGDGNKERGYRFIWRKPNGTLQAARGQARIPSIADINYLIGQAIAEGWGNEIGDGGSLSY